jgi:hypothetical protein
MSESPGITEPPVPEVVTQVPVRQPFWLRALALLGVASFFSVYAWWPFFAAYPRTIDGDGPYFQRFAEAARASIVHYGELPLWNPYECGGIPLWDNPEVFVLSPLYLITLPFEDSTRAMQFWYAGHSALGFICMWLFVRSELGLSRLAALAASIVWAFLGFHQHHYAGGHTTFVSFLFLPLAFLLWRRAEKDLRFAVGLGLLFALMIYEAGTYSLPHFALALFVETLTRLRPAKRIAPIALAVAIVGVVTITVGAARFLPLIDQMRAHTRALGSESDYLSFKTLSEMFTAHDLGRHQMHVEGQVYVWGEYGSYIGLLTVLLAGLGIVACGAEYAWMVFVLAVMVVFMFGNFAPFAPWSLLRGHVFPFKEMRVPSRFGLETSFFLVAFAGLAADRFVGWASRTFGRFASRIPKSIVLPDARAAMSALLVGVALVGAGDVLSLAVDLHAQHLGFPGTTRVQPSPRLYFGGPGLAPFMDQPRQNRGRLDCWSEWAFYSGAPLWQGDVPQARARDDGAVVEVANRTQNTFTIDVNVSRPSVVLVNSTFDKGWRTNVGRTLEKDKQLALELPPGQHRVIVRYWPQYLTLGLVLTPIALALSILALLRPEVFRRALKRISRSVKMPKSAHPSG